MKAVVYDKRNSPNTLILRDIEKPIPGDNEVLIKIYAVSVNAADYRSMKMGIIPKGKIFGADITGRVEAVGNDIGRLAVGDEVFGDISAYGFGGFAEYVVAPEDALAIKPAIVSFEMAAAIPMSAVTALQALRDKGKVREGQKILICGAGGGVGTFAVQLAKYFGAEVTAVCGEKNVALIQSLGADCVIDYKQEDIAKSSKRFDLILAINGHHSLFTYKRLLAPKGIYVMVGGTLSQVFKSILFGALLSIGNKKMCSLAAKQSRRDLEFIIGLVTAGRVKPVIDRQYPLDRTAEAIGYLSSGHVRGKVIIEVTQSPWEDPYA
jgi:NADPH:quinone reductase-like Zn-dependent oxidoreductase